MDKKQNKKTTTMKTESWFSDPAEWESRVKTRSVGSLDKELKALEPKVPCKVSQLCLNLISNSDRDTFSAVLEQCWFIHDVSRC